MSFAPQGGAGQVARTLSRGQSQLGIQADLRYASKHSLRDNPLENPMTTIATGMDDFVLKNQKSKQQVSILRSRASANLNLKEIANNYDVLHLHWIEGMITDSQIAEVGKAGVIIAWTLHDMRPFTGACHQAGDCDNFKTSCSNCPELRALFTQYAKASLAMKMRQLENVDIKFIAPSSWIAESFRASAFGSNRSIEVIPNSIDDVFFEVSTSVESRDTKFLFIANNVSDPNKGFLEVLGWFHTQSDEDSLAVIGAGSDGFARRPNLSFTGPAVLPDIVQAMDKSRFLIVNSTAETAPLVISEAAARGVIPLVAARLQSSVHPLLQVAGCKFFKSIDDLETIAKSFGQVELDSASKHLKLAAKKLHNSATVSQSYLDRY
jgi:glycosyltransferase involved in cell wall biosynthesis